jgi:hypothetical protein
MEEEKYKVRSFMMTIREENGKYVLTKGQLQFLINQNRSMFSLLNRFVEERERLEFLLAEHRLKKLGILAAESHLN